MNQPISPNLGFYRKLAKDLKRALATSDAAAIERVTKVHRALPASFSLGDAQLVIAREHGHASWAELEKAVESAALTPQLPAPERLLAAIGAGDLAAARALLDGDRSLANRPTEKGVLPLVEAADRGQLALVALLLDAGADPLRGDPLLAAAHAGPHKPRAALDVVALLIARGAPDDVFTHAALGRLDALARSIVGVDLEARGPASSTALFLAAWNGHLDAVRLLLDAGAAPNPVGRNGETAWQLVFKHGWSAPHRAIARLLLERGVACSLHEACRLSHLPTVRQRVAEDPAALGRADERGLLPVDIAVLGADRPLATLLLELGAADAKGQAHALLHGTRQEKQDLSQTVFQNCSLQRVNFHDCNLSNAVLSNVNLSGMRIDNANLSGARIENASIRGLTIYGIDVEPLLVKELERRARRSKRD